MCGMFLEIVSARFCSVRVKAKKPGKGRFCSVRVKVKKPGKGRIQLLLVFKITTYSHHNHYSAAEQPTKILSVVKTAKVFA